MTPQELRNRTKRFALDVLKFCMPLRHSDVERTIGRQLLRSGTGVGANYRAVCRARSDREFIAKLGVTIEEADESAYWLEILVDSALIPARNVARLQREADELTRMFVAARQTVRRRYAKSRIRNRESRNRNHQSQVANHK